MKESRKIELIEHALIDFLKPIAEHATPPFQGEIKPKHLLREHLGLDSMDIVDVEMELEERFDLMETGFAKIYEEANRNDITVSELARGVLKYGDPNLVAYYLEKADKKVAPKKPGLLRSACAALKGHGQGSGT